MSTFIKDSKHRKHCFIFIGPGLYTDSPYSISNKVYIPISRSCRNIFCLCRYNGERCIFI